MLKTVGHWQQSRTAPAVTALSCGAKKCATHNFKKASSLPPTATSEAPLLPWWPSEAFLCFPPGTASTATLPRHRHRHPDTLLCLMTARPPPRLSTRLWTGQTPVCRLVTTPSVPMSSVLTQAEAVTLSIVFKYFLWFNLKERALKYC